MQRTKCLDGELSKFSLVDYTQTALIVFYELN